MSVDEPLTSRGLTRRAVIARLDENKENEGAFESQFETFAQSLFPTDRIFISGNALSDSLNCVGLGHFSVVQF